MPSHKKSRRSRSKLYKTAHKVSGKRRRCHNSRKRTLPIVKLKKLAKSRGISLGKSKKKNSILSKLRSRGVHASHLQC